MLGFKAKTFKPHTKVSLEDLVPQDNFYRHVEANLDLSFVRDLVRDCYSPTMGRPSIDPVVFFKLQLIMFFEGIRSERQLMETVSLNLAHRWYIAYDLDEPVPDHSSLSKIRGRYGLQTFERFFEHIVELCIEAGLVWGRELYFDTTKVQANAALLSNVPRFYFAAKQHLKHLFDSKREVQDDDVFVIGGPEWADRDTADIATSRGFVEKYSQAGPTGKTGTWYQRTADIRTSPTDPDATPMKRFNGDRTVMGYHDHYVVDGGKARIILAALVTPASIMDTTPMLDLARWVRFRWRLKPKIAVGDTKYGTESNIVGLEQDGIRAYLPRPDNSQRTGRYPPERFHYNPKDDSYICPQGQVLSYWHSKYTEGNRVYRAEAEVCNACRAKAKCTTSLTGRHLRRSFFQEYLDQAAEYRETEAYKRALRKRKLWPEPLFGEAKQWHGLRQFRLRGLWKVNTEGLMVAAGQNLKRLLTYQGWGQRRGPAGWGAALALAPPFRPTELDHPPL